jgi:hypothetical protein
VRQPSSEHATVRIVERDPSGRHRVGRVAAGLVTVSAHPFEDRRDDRRPPRIVSGTIAGEAHPLAGPADHAVAAREAEQVICSCRAHGDPHDRRFDLV